MPTITLDDGQYRVNGLMTRAESDFIERARMAQFYLVLNDGGEIGERGKCQRCGLLHRYLTYMCVERPFRGVEEGLRTWLRAGTDEAKRSKVIRALSTVPDLATRHPATARDLRPDSPGEAWYSLLIGVAEPITDAAARRFAQRINDRRPRVPFVL
jgi:hypothetical protein